MVLSKYIYIVWKRFLWKYDEILWWDLNWINLKMKLNGLNVICLRVMKWEEYVVVIKVLKFYCLIYRIN